LNRLRTVKEFLKGGGAESYEGIKINWIKGRRPVMRIFGDKGQFIEQVDLAQYDPVENKEYTAGVQGLHTLMQQKGFIKKRVFIEVPHKLEIAETVVHKPKLRGAETPRRDSKQVRPMAAGLDIR